MNCRKEAQKLFTTEFLSIFADYMFRLLEKPSKAITNIRKER